MRSRSRRRSHELSREATAELYRQEARAHLESPPPPPSPLISPPPPEKKDDIVSLKLTAGGKSHTLRLKLLPEHSPESVAFMRHAATTGCAGELYRSEKDFLVQGRISCQPSASMPKVVKGACPPGAKVEKGRSCPLARSKLRLSRSNHGQRNGRVGGWVGRP